MFETDDILSKTIEKGKEKNEWKNNEYQSRRNTCFDKTYDSKTNFHDHSKGVSHIPALYRNCFAASMENGGSRYSMTSESEGT